METVWVTLDLRIRCRAGKRQSPGPPSRVGRVFPVKNSKARRVNALHALSNCTGGSDGNSDVVFGEGSSERS